VNSLEFRSNAELSGLWGKELRENGVLQRVLEVLEHENPVNFTLAPNAADDVSPTAAAIELGKTRGYALALNKMRVLAVPPPRSDAGELESEYKSPDETPPADERQPKKRTKRGR
jgi:hypothetical protein